MGSNLRDCSCLDHIGDLLQILTTILLKTYEEYLFLFLTPRMLDLLRSLWLLIIVTISVFVGQEAISTLDDKVIVAQMDKMYLRIGYLGKGSASENLRDLL